MIFVPCNMFQTEEGGEIRPTGTWCGPKARPGLAVIEPRCYFAIDFSESEQGHAQN